MAETNPFTGTPYNSWDDVERDLKDHPECKAKIMLIWKRIQKLMTHDEIRDLCGIWGCATWQEMMNKINRLTNEELGKEVEKVIAKRKAALKYLASQRKVKVPYIS